MSGLLTPAYASANITACAGVIQWSECLLPKQDVGSSNLLTRSITDSFHILSFGPYISLASIVALFMHKARCTGLAEYIFRYSN